MMYRIFESFFIFLSTFMFVMCPWYSGGNVSSLLVVTSVPTYKPKDVFVCWVPQRELHHIIFDIKEIISFRASTVPAFHSRVVSAAKRVNLPRISSIVRSLKYIKERDRIHISYSRSAKICLCKCK